ncbi:ATPase, AAA family protein [Enhygromyxa salina]|uniref:ATPase, AAA family protein n=1 Tax=Enhygromyxa salina TaxID=215803 RepID=A0A0C1ZK91_9BACT|nr:AAA family ATPase [Enhygromyxa salina]KIG17894.1 ATPase, AAA family protein [Enhygromyxa salina]
MSSAIPIDRVRAEQARPPEHPVLARVVELVRLRAARRLDWEQAVRAGQVEGHSRADDLAGELEYYESNSNCAAANQRISELEQQRIGDESDPLLHIAKIFSLSVGELDLLITCLAVALEPELGPLYARLQGSPERCYATETLTARLFGWGRQTLWHQGGQLATWGLVRCVDRGPGQPMPLTVDPMVRARLQGQLRLDAELIGVAELGAAQPQLESWPLSHVSQRIETALEQRRSIRVVLIGPPGCGRRSLASAAAEQFRASALLIDTDEIDDAAWPELYVRACRMCMLGGLIPVWYGSRVSRRWPRSVDPVHVQFVACEDPSELSRQVGVVDEHVVIPSSTLDERRELWRRLVPASVTWPERERESLASRHRLAVGDIAEIGRRMPADPSEAALMAREQTRGRLGELGRLLDCPFDWTDLVLPAQVRETLEDFAFEAAERASFWEQPAARRLFPRGTGLVALLTGPPGTGKTMAAQVVAAELQLDLFRINLATVISKYIGETAKNLDMIFSRAGRMNAVLLFDEADALFSKRTEVKDSHDRHANTDTNYLLQLLEDYQGIALLASNKKNNIDPAFIRRIRYVLSFRRPDAAQRRAIWRKVLGELLGADLLRPLEPAIAVLADAVEISGAQIKNAVLAALFIARRARKSLAAEHLVAGIDRELGKEGRSLSERERERLRHHA